MNKKVFILLLNLLFCLTFVSAQEAEKSDLQKRAEAVNPKEDIAKARSLFIHAFNDYANKGKTAQAVECAVKATPLYYSEGFYKEAFDLLQRAEQVILAGVKSPSEQASLQYLTIKERMQMYIKMRRVESAKEQLKAMEVKANESSNENLKNDLLYNKAIYYYTFGLNAQGNAVFKEMANNNNASLVAQAYSNYIAWKDSTDAIKRADEIGALNKQIEEHKATIEDKDSSLSSRMAIIVGLCILAGALAAALIVGAVVLMRYILLTRKQKKTIKLANDSNALKAKFISNISAQLEPTLQKLDSSIPEVKALLDFSHHVQTLSELENTSNDAIEYEEIQITQFCEGLMNEIRDKVKKDVNLTVNAPKMVAKINQEYVTHILLHLLNNAAEYTPEGGNIWLEYKKRGPKAHQFLVSDTGEGIPEEKREDVFKPFLEIRDLTTGDGLGLPTCKQMALKMNGDLDIDPNFTKGTRFVLDLHS